MADQSYSFDTTGAMFCDIFIYYGPAGKDAAAECGIAWATRLPLTGSTRVVRKPMYALKAKGEDFGLMRKMFDEWFGTVDDLINHLCEKHPISVVDHA